MGWTQGKSINLKSFLKSLRYSTLNYLNALDRCRSKDRKLMKIWNIKDITLINRALKRYLVILSINTL